MLNSEDKRLLINELWDDIEGEDAKSPDPGIVEILESRWKKYESDPTTAMTLEEFRERIGVS
ncbi:MAG: addiction module protein [Verrucomicrobiales bacterium]|nr:addiction module protein [Verrucomicrobiales bacterium]